MKQLVAYFIKYPVASWVLIIFFFIFGIMGMLSMKSSFFPLVENRFITINLAYPGASPFEMEEGIVLKIEENLKGLPGIERFTSRCMENSAVITVEVKKNYNPANVLFDVKNAVDRVPSYPAAMEPPVVSRREAMNEAISFVVTGSDVPLVTLKRLARKIEYEIRSMKGISQVQISGFPLEEIEIAVREKDLRAYNLTFEEISRAVANANILTTGGRIKTESEEYLIRVKNKSYYADELDFLIVRTDQDGNTIRLRDVAQVTDKFAEDPDRTLYNGEAAIDFTVMSTNNEDLIGITKMVNKYIEDFNGVNNNVQIKVTRDASESLLERRLLLQKNGLFGIFLVLLLLSVFLRPQLAFWVAFGLPLSFLGMFIVAPHLDVTINALSLFGMIIVIGILVDDSIVVGENIYHHYEKGKTRLQATIDGTLEVAPPVFSAVLTTVIAFSAFFFLEGRLADNYGQVALIVILTLSISLVEALIILPSHIAHSKQVSQQKLKPNILNRWGDRFIEFFRDKLYGPYLAFFLKHRLLGIAIPLSAFIITVGALMGGIVKTTFFANIESDRIVVNLDMIKGTSEKITLENVLKIEDAVWALNEEYTKKQTGNLQVVENIITQIGPGSSTASVRINLLPGDQRDFSAIDLTNALREKVGPIHGSESLTFGSGSRFGGAPVAISLVGYNIEELKSAKLFLKDLMTRNPKLKDVKDNDPAGINEIMITLKPSAYMLGLTYNDVMAQVRSAFFGRQVQRLQRGQDEVRVWVRYAMEDRDQIKNLEDIRIMTPGGQRVPLVEIVEYEIRRGEVAINHIDGKREIQVTAELSDAKDSATEVLGDVKTQDVTKVLAKFPSVSVLYEGQNREAEKTGDSSRTVIPVILFLIFAVIAFTFRTFSQPLILMLMIPLSLIGVAWGHWLHGIQVSMLSTLGIIALIGIVVNDGLVLISKFNIYLTQGMPYDEALVAAGKSRLRAILLTSMTTVAGLAPLIFEKSRQAQFLIPMALSLTYGIIISTFLTLLLLPILLSYVNDMKVHSLWLWTGKKPARESVERAIRESKQENHA